MTKLTLNQIEDQIDHYQAMLNFERAIVKDGLASEKASNIKVLEAEVRRWLQMSIDRRTEAGLAKADA